MAEVRCYTVRFSIDEPDAVDQAGPVQPRVSSVDIELFETSEEAAMARVRAILAPTFLAKFGHFGTAHLVRCLYVGRL